MKYEMTKTIRFQLEPVGNRAREASDSFCVELCREAKPLERLVSDLEGFSRMAQEILFEQRRDGEEVLRRKLKVKRGWLRSALSRFYFDLPEEERMNKRKAIPSFLLNQFPFVRESIESWFVSWNSAIQMLADIAQKPEESQSRKREIAGIIMSIQGRGKFDFMRDLLTALCRTNDMSGVDDQVDEARQLSLELEAELLRQSAKHAPSFRGSGLRIAKGTFNFFTLNKSPKELDEAKKAKEREFEKPLERRLFERTHRESDRTVVDFECTDQWFRGIGYTESFQNIPIRTVREELKNWKAKQKNGFLEATDALLKSVRERGYGWNDYNRFKDEWQETQEKFPLFASSPDDSLCFLRNSWEKDELVAEKNKQSDAEQKQFIQERIKKKKQERSVFFDCLQRAPQTKQYFEFCEFFKRVSLKYGKIRAEILGIESERRESQLLRYWCFFIEKDSRRFIVFVPRSGSRNEPCAKLAKDFLEKAPKKIEREASVQLSFFRSLTFRALWKLCFKKTENTFFPPVREELIRKFGMDERDFEQWVVKGLQMKLRARFYQDVLETRSARRGIGISPESLDCFVGNKYNAETESADPYFISDLERSCYERDSRFLSLGEYNRFLEEYQAIEFEIASQDIRIKSEKRPEVVEGHKQKAHTDIWNGFWDSENKQNAFPIRVNPEVSFFLRESDESLEKKIASGSIAMPEKLPEFRNRFAKSRFTLALTMTLNAGEKKSCLSFKTTKDIVEYIDDFNQEFDARFKGEWRYGIDRGLKELATLCIVRFPNGNNTPEFPKIPVWRLKRAHESSVLEDRKGKSRPVAKNLSYFIEREELFECRETGCIDLTMAKVVGGKIVENADAETYFRLKERSARRRIFELLSRAEIDRDSNIVGDTVLKIANKKTGEDSEVYWLTERQRGDETAKGSIRKRLQEYLSELSEKNALEDAETIEEINHLRDAITANMVGVIVHIQKSFPGKIALENMEWKEHIEKQTVRQSYENISRRLEWALYRKFQRDGSVPPIVKQSVLAREFLKERQFGIIRFVPIEQTSNQCPKCGGIGKKHGRHYRCGENNGCGFRTDRLIESDSLEPLENADKVAAYNIAKLLL